MSLVGGLGVKVMGLGIRDFDFQGSEEGSGGWVFGVQGIRLRIRDSDFEFWGQDVGWGGGWGLGVSSSLELWEEGRVWSLGFGVWG